MVKVVSHTCARADIEMVWHGVHEQPPCNQRCLDAVSGLAAEPCVYCCHAAPALFLRPATSPALLLPLCTQVMKEPSTCISGGAREKGEREGVFVWVRERERDQARGSASVHVHVSLSVSCLSVSCLLCLSVSACPLDRSTLETIFAQSGFVRKKVAIPSQFSRPSGLAVRGFVL